jgi:hypothetical protein
MSLTKVWLQTHSDGLVRGDQVVGIDVHQTPALTGKRPHWLIDVLLPGGVGNGRRGEWDITQLHRTLVQTSDQPGEAPTALARLLAQLDAIDATGVVVTQRCPDHGPDGVNHDSCVRFRFVPFTGPPPGHPTGAEYL